MKNNSENGFTIVELLVSISLLAMLVIVVLTPMANSFQMTSTSRNNLQATSSANQILEKARQIIVTNYNSPTTINTLLSAPQFAGVVCENVNLYNVVITGHQYCSDTSLPIPPIRRLTLTKASVAGSSKNDILFTVGVSKP